MILITSPPTSEGLRFSQPNTQAFMGNNSSGNGTLYISESCVSWVSETGDGFSLDYKKISLHAISRDLAAFPHECLYLMVDEKLTGDNDGNDSSSSSDSDDQPTTDVRFAPVDNGTLDAMFEAMSDCQALHPDEEDSFSDDGGEDYYQDAEDLELSERGQATLDRLEEMFMARGDNSQVHPPNGDARIMFEPPTGQPAVVDTNNRQANNSEEPMDQGQFEDADG